MIAYLTTLTLIWACGLALYYGLLARTTRHGFARGFLLAVLLGGLIVPVLPHWGGGPELLPAAGALPRTVWLPAATVAAEGVRAIPTWVWVSLATVAYLCVGVAGALDLRRVAELRRSRRPVEVGELPAGLRVYETPVASSPFSIGRSLYVADWDGLEPLARRALVEHEAEHARLHHTLDNVALAAVCVVLWWHPLAYALRRALRLVHEFQADAAVLDTVRPPHYYEVLLRFQLAGAPSRLATSFTQSPLKLRFAMMTRPTTRFPTARVVLASFALAILGAACTKDSYEESDLTELTAVNEDAVAKAELISARLGEWAESDNVSVRMDTLETFDPETLESEIQVFAVLVNESTGETLEFDMTTDLGSEPSERFRSAPVYKVTSQMPMFPGCPDEADNEARQKCSQRLMLEHVYTNIKYPEVAREAGTEGTSVVSFIVGTDGELLDPIIARSISPEIDAEVLRMLGTMPAWIPGREQGLDVQVRFNLPVKFRLD